LKILWAGRGLNTHEVLRVKILSPTLYPVIPKNGVLRAAQEHKNFHPAETDDAYRTV
jgi:hypothetical protein